MPTWFQLPARACAHAYRRCTSAPANTTRCSASTPSTTTAWCPAPPRAPTSCRCGGCLAGWLLVRRQLVDDGQPPTPGAPSNRASFCMGPRPEKMNCPVPACLRAERLAHVPLCCAHLLELLPHHPHDQGRVPRMWVLAGRGSGVPAGRWLPSALVAVHLTAPSAPGCCMPVAAHARP